MEFDDLSMFLFTPADRLDRLEKATATDADAIVVDLDQKEAARRCGRGGCWTSGGRGDAGGDASEAPDLKLTRSSASAASARRRMRNCSAKGVATMPRPVRIRIGDTADAATGRGRRARLEKAGRRRQQSGCRPDHAVALHAADDPRQWP